ncbi:ABC transporter permease [Haloimpatiens lingqiaonensis]|uniref:ABC transporter permease n=1 Tax=Haloimpatiens lingqiaonensis TaxID=1380675 RepID=UPI0010FD695A|nr:ABC transporter permease [Haloimpatiens lingqiaonensis]
MKILYIILYNLRRNFRDKKVLANMLLLPVVVILILGTALKSQYTPGDIGKAKVYYCIEDRNEMTRSFEKYITSDELKDIVEVKKVKSKKEGLESIKANERGSFIYMDKDSTENIRNGKKIGISLYNQRNNIQTEITKNLLNGFVNGANAVYASYTIGGNDKYAEGNNSIIDSSIDISGKIPKAIDYYAVTMLVMTLMYGSLYGKYAISEIYKEQGIRVTNTPTRKIEILIGYISASVLTVFFEGLILMLIAKYAFKANYGSNMGLIVFIIFSMSVLSNFIGMAMATLVRKDDKAAGILNILVVVFTFVSGGYSKNANNNETYNKIMHFIPNGMAHNAMFNSIYGSNTELINSSILAMWIGIVLCLIISVVVERRRPLQ